MITSAADCGFLQHVFVDVSVGDKGALRTPLCCCCCDMQRDLTRQVLLCMGAGCIRGVPCHNCCHMPGTPSWQPDSQPAALNVLA